MAVNDGTIPRKRGGLEALVLQVCDDITRGAVPNDPPQPWTPYRLAQLVLAKFPGSGANPSTGAISDTLKRWRDYGFAEINEKPLAFNKFTEAARTEGLDALKEKHRASRPPRASKPKAIAPSGTVTLQVNPGQADDDAASDEQTEAVAEQTRALEEVEAEVPSPGDALAEAEGVQQDTPERVYVHDDAEYAQGDPHPTARDDVQSGWQPRDEWEEADPTETTAAPNSERVEAVGGEARDVRSIELGEEQFTDNRDPFGEDEGSRD